MRQLLNTSVWQTHCVGLTVENTALEDTRCLKLFLHNVLLVAIVQILHIRAYLIHLAQKLKHKFCVCLVVFFFFVPLPCRFSDLTPLRSLFTQDSGKVDQY